MSLSRRCFALGAAALIPAFPALAAPAAYPPSLAFAAYRNGKRIGEHRMSFETADDILTVRTQAEMAVKLGPVTVYRYHHEATERWRAGRFERLETHTLSGGKREGVIATRTAAGVTVAAEGAAPIVAAPTALPFTHWNIEIARAPLFNPQTGKLVKDTVHMLGDSPVAAADGRMLQARRIGFTGEAIIDNWYDAADIWTGLRGRLEDGSTMEYRRL